VIENNPERFQLLTMAAGSNIEAALSDARRWKPKVLSLASEQDAERVRKQLKAEGLGEIEIVHGQAGTVRVATHPEVDFVVSAIVGVAGLKATYEAVRAGKAVGLANKECLVAAGELITAEARKQGKPLLPIDSEHNAVHQCMRGGRMNEVDCVWLTASGGPFLNTQKSDFEKITVEQALNHPTWKMGQRITIDSATLMNKGFEVIEACWLFDFSADEVDVVIHPQSTVHAMVEYTDGSVIAQISATDMRMPIQYALTYPARESAPVPRLDWTQARNWNFYAPDLDKFPALRLAYEALRAGGSATCALNAADEVAVEAFLHEEIPFLSIPAVIEETLERVPVRQPKSIEEVLEVDEQSRSVARQIVRKRAQTVYEERGPVPAKV
jgi:1-deoxy-D-xylulose-5-phosphate reductoisomerase